MNEIWKEIPGYAGKYSISNFGNVRSNYYKNRRMLKPSPKNNGYLTVRLYSNFVGKSIQIHSLVANAFLPNPNNFPMIIHKDGNRTNNKVENLEWCSMLSYNTYNNTEENAKKLLINILQNNTEEIWKVIPGYDEKYLISNFGNVCSIQHGKKRILKPMRNAGKCNGYLTVTLYNNSIGKKVKIHRLVAEAFLPNPNNLPIINHKDEDKTNNNVDNLEWCTKLYNNTYNGLRNRATETWRRNHKDK